MKVRWWTLLILMIPVYYFWSFLGLIAGFISYGGPANQGLAASLTVLTYVLLVAYFRGKSG